MSRLLKSTFFSLLVLSIAFSAAAQSIPGIAEPITFTVSPQFPRPNSTVSVRAQSYNTDLNRADFTWYVDGKVFKRGRGLSEISVPMGKAGSVTSVSADISTSDIGDISHQATFRPADVTLAWESDGHVPPFYEGKALELYGSSFKVSAIPEMFSSGGRRMDPKTLIYTWKRNGTVDAAQSGYGKDSYTSVQSSYVRGGDEIAVEVSTTDKSFGATGAIAISPRSVETIFYEHSPLYGIIYERALKNEHVLGDEEITLRAEPFYVSKSKDDIASTKTTWIINGGSVPNFEGSKEITLRETGVPGGRTDIGFRIQNEGKVLQGGEAHIYIIQ